MFLPANLIKEFEKELYVELLAGYESLARPVERATDPVNVSLGIALQQIVDIVEKEQMIILNVWLTFVSSPVSDKLVLTLFQVLIFDCSDGMTTDSG